MTDADSDGRRWAQAERVLAWRLDDPADRPEAVNLVLNLVARPFAFDRPRTVEFSLQATPIRPSTRGPANASKRSLWPWS